MLKPDRAQARLRKLAQRSSWPRQQSLSCCNGISSCGRFGLLPPHARRACGGATYLCANLSGATCVGAGLGGGQSRWLITVWLEVRVLPSPPRSPSNLQISRRRPKSPQLAGSCGWVSVSAETVSGLKAILGGLSLGRGIPFPRCRLILDEDWSGCGASFRGSAERTSRAFGRLGW
jgi:hypothetical protein